MSAADLKLFFRTLLKVVPGGPPVGTPGSARVAGVLAALDKLADVLFGAELVNVPLLDPARDYPVSFVVRAEYGGVSYTFFSRSGGAHPAPPDYLGDNNWGPAAPTPPPPTALSDTRPLSYAQYMLSRYPDSIKPGLLYLLPGQWNSAPGPPDTVEVEGGQGGFAALGTLVTGGQRLPVTVDVAAGTYDTGLNSGPAAPLRDVYPAQAKREQVVSLFTSGTQTTAADVALSGDTTSYLFSEFYDFQAGYWYKCLPNPTQPDGPGNATAWWVRR